MERLSTKKYYKISTQKNCPECGTVFKITQECYLMECDRCLSKKEES
ncbi:YhfH family protein [Bacillus sp. AGMB 02131]|uniref:YhfH family protein n=1 Tax=Peribacillus faecalis TaxID=2772559 RepID=A0A927HCS8_9BACI|nr:protein YhfH [Peribacillus faecalis]MBD3109957.1 YhfH family protein [Peribacillus faecalis]